MQSAKRKIALIVVNDSALIVEAEEAHRLFSSTAGTVDGRILIVASALPPQMDIAFRPEKREKDYWKSKYDRFKKRR